MQYTIDKESGRKTYTANRIGEIIPFTIIEREKRERALIIERANGYWMSIKKGQKIKMFPMKVID